MSQTLFCCLLLHSTGMVGDEESLPKRGVLTSPNYPERYPESHDSTQTITVAEGKTIRLQWTDIDTEPEHDYVQAVDADGTKLMGKISGNMCGSGSAALWDVEDRVCEGRVFESSSNIVHIKFHTDSTEQRTGWRLEWTEQ